MARHYPQQNTNLRMSGSLLVFLAALVLLQPLFSTMHLTWADHQHRFNPALGLYEDIVVSGENSRSSMPSTSQSRGIRGSDGHQRQAVSFSICLTSNLSQARYTTNAVAQAGFQADFSQKTDLDVASTICAQAPLFMTAPKQSPPALFG